MKKIISLIIITALISSSLSCIALIDTSAYKANVLSSILVDFKTGEILQEQNSHEKLPPASITKIMTMLLAMEKIDTGKISLTDIATVSKKASKMTGSRVFLSENEQISIEELLKSIAISSGNDAAVVMAEYISGSEDKFVELMNERAQELGMNDTNFMNCHGLDSENHYSSAFDIAVMSRELLKHEKIMDYTTIWIDYIRNGTFMLSSTNRLVHDYDGATGLKTGSTTKAKSCLSGSAKRGNLHLVSVIMGAETSKIRFEESEKLLDYGFKTFTLLENIGANDSFEDLPIIGGKEENLTVSIENTVDKILTRDKTKEIKKVIDIKDEVEAPIKKGDKVGEIAYKVDGETIATIPIVATISVDKITFKYIFVKMIDILLMKKIV